MFSDKLCGFRAIKGFFVRRLTLWVHWGGWGGGTYTGEDGVEVCALGRMGWRYVHWGGLGAGVCTGEDGVEVCTLGRMGWRCVHLGGWVLRMDEVIVHTHGLSVLCNRIISCD